MTKVCKILSSMEQMKWIIILIISDNVRAKRVPSEFIQSNFKRNQKEVLFYVAYSSIMVFTGSLSWESPTGKRV